MDETAAQNQPPDSGLPGARCEKHGLLYNASDTRGCVLCRREAGEPVTTAPSTVAETGGALPQAWLIAAGLILTTTIVLYLAHDHAIETVVSWAGPANFSSRDAGDSYETPEGTEDEDWEEEGDGFGEE